MAPKILKKNDLVVKNEKTNFINKKLKEYQKFIKKILNMLVRTLHMRQDLFITMKKKIKKAYMEKQLTKKFQNLKMKEQIHK